MKQGNAKLYINVFALLIIVGIIVYNAYVSFGENTNLAQQEVEEKVTIVIN